MRTVICLVRFPTSCRSLSSLTVGSEPSEAARRPSACCTRRIRLQTRTSAKVSLPSHSEISPRFPQPRSFLVLTKIMCLSLVIIATVYNLGLPSTKRRTLLRSFDLLRLAADDFIALFSNPFIGSIRNDDHNPVRASFFYRTVDSADLA